MDKAYLDKLYEKLSTKKKVKDDADIIDADQ